MKLGLIKVMTKKSSLRVFALAVLTICLTLSATQVIAGVLKTDLQLVLPKSEMVNEALKQKGALKFSRESLTFSSEFPVELKNIDLDFEYQVRSLNPGLGGAFATEVEVTKVVARAASLKIDTILQVEASGVKAKIPIKAFCQGVTIRNEKPVVFQLKGQVRELPRLSLQLEDVDWAHVAGVWKLETASCEAAPGFTAFLNEQLAKLWSESKDLPAYVFEDVNRELEEWFAGTLRVEKDVPELYSHVTLEGKTFQDAGDAWVFGIEMRVDANPNEKTLCATLKDDVYLPAHSQKMNVKTSEIWANEKVVELWGRCLHERGKLKREDRGQEIAGFRKLMSSRFLQFFVWQDLMRFPKSTDFHFMTSSYGALSMRPVAASSGVSYALSTQIASRMLYPEAGRWASYMTFYTPVSLELAMSVKNSKLRIGMKGAPRTALKYRFDVPVGQLYSSSVGISTIESEVKDFLAQEIFEIELPQLQLGPDIEVEAANLRRENQTLKMGLKRR